MNEAIAVPQTTYWDTQSAVQPYSIKRHGVSLSNCDAEPVQTPGCVQGHGALLVLRIADLCILQASESTQDLFGRPAATLLGLRVGTVVQAAGEARLLSMLAHEPTDRNPVYAFTLPAGAQGRALDVTLHTIDGAAVLEFEISDHGAGPHAPVPAASTDYRPIAPDYYGIIKKAVVRLQLASTLQQYCHVLADEVRMLTGMDRVMIYRFHADDHGEVFAESKVDALAPWLGLHYPAEDIPKPAREIFSRTWIRPVPDIAATLAEMVPLQNPDTGQPLDMTYCALRGVSVMYTEYLQNMGVTAGVTMPLRRGLVLWGLIACHHYQGPLSLPYELRAACEFLAQVASLQHQAAEDRENAAYRSRLDEVRAQLVMTASRSGALQTIAEGSPCLLDAMQAGGAALYDQNRWWRMGATPSDAQLDALAKWLAQRQDAESGDNALYVTDSLATDYPPGAAYADLASGVLAAPISRSGQKRLMWFRPELIQTINWGGNPQDKPMVTGPFGPRLTPRRSFELFSETVRLRALPWKQVEIDTARGLRTQLQELVVGNAERLAALNADLERSNEELNSFAYVASHDLKEPLRGIHKYAHQLLDRAASSSSTDDRHRLEGLMRLTLRMDSLLDSLLLFSRVGREELMLEPVDLNVVLADAVEMVGSRTEDGRSEIVVPRVLPTLICDRIRVREVLVNLLSNALKYNGQPTRRIEVGYIDADEEARRENFPPDLGRETVFYVGDNGIGIQPRHFAQVFKIFKRLHARDEYGGGSGVGLTIVRKLVERHRGQVWLESVPGEGSRFLFTLGATAYV